jgi:hypothetical protein
MVSELPTVEMLHRLLVCDAEAGRLFWRARTPDLFASGRQTAEHNCASWNSRWAGKEAFTADDGMGYRQGAIFGRLYRAHRVIWCMVHGAWPVEMLDHIDGNTSNNRLSNLRGATYAENNRNVRSADGSTSEYLGVFWSKSESRWVAAIKPQRRKITLGRFKDECDAARAYDAAARVHFGTFARLNFPEAAS